MAGRCPAGKSTLLKSLAGKMQHISSIQVRDSTLVYYTSNAFASCNPSKQ